MSNLIAGIGVKDANEAEAMVAQFYIEDREQIQKANRSEPFFHAKFLKHDGKDVTKTYKEPEKWNKSTLLGWGGPVTVNKEQDGIHLHFRPAGSEPKSVPQYEYVLIK